MAKVVATQRGYFGGMIREGGDIFTVPDGAKASWWRSCGDGDAVADPEPAKEEVKQDEPEKKVEEKKAAGAAAKKK